MAYLIQGWRIHKGVPKHTPGRQTLEDECLVETTAALHAVEAEMRAAGLHVEVEKGPRAALETAEERDECPHCGYPRSGIELCTHCGTEAPNA